MCPVRCPELVNFRSHVEHAYGRSPVSVMHFNFNKRKNNKINGLKDGTYEFVDEL